MLERGRWKYPSTPLQVKEHLELHWGEHLSPAVYVMNLDWSKAVVLEVWSSDQQHCHHLGPCQKSADATGDLLN